MFVKRINEVQAKIETNRTEVTEKIVVENEIKSYYDLSVQREMEFKSNYGFRMQRKKKRLEAKDEGEIIIGKGETSVIENGSHFQREIRFTGN